jgi:small conductance mechanosensitive channel
MDINKALELIESKLLLWMREFVRMLPNLLIAVIVIVVGLYLSKLVKRFAGNMLNRFSHGAIISNLFTSVIYILCLGITLFIALSILQLDKALTSLLAGAGIAGLALAFAFQDIAANFMSGILISSQANKSRRHYCGKRLHGESTNSKLKRYSCSNFSGTNGYHSK